MRRLVSLVVLVLATQPAAADGVYFTESFGGTDVKDELSAHMGSALRIRVGLGVRRGSLAVELWGAGNINTEAHDHDAAPPEPYHGSYVPHSSTNFASYGVDVKLLRPLAHNLEIYLRGGLSAGYAEGLDAGGRGLGAGAGIQLKGKVSALGLLFWPLFFSGVGPKMTGALYFDSSYELYRLHGASRSTDAQLSHATFGFALGSDF